jgi:hypothetical protein
MLQAILDYAISDDSNISTGNNNVFYSDFIGGVWLARR